MRRVELYDPIKSLFQDIIVPEMHALRSDIRRIDEKIDHVDAREQDRHLGAQVGHMKGELIAEIRRVDIRIDGVERELRVAIDIRERLAALEARRA
jgi:hypothetical protein